MVNHTSTEHFNRDCLCLSEFRTAACGSQAKELHPMSTKRHRKHTGNAEKHVVSNKQHGAKSYLSSASHEIPRILCKPKADYAFTRARHLPHSWSWSIRSTYPYSHPVSWTSVLKLSPHLRLGLVSGLFPSDFSNKTSSHSPAISFFTVSPGFAWWKVQITNLPITHFPPVSCCFLNQHPISRVPSAHVPPLVWQG